MKERSISHAHILQKCLVEIFSHDNESKKKLYSNFWNTLQDLIQDLLQYDFAYVEYKKSDVVQSHV